MLFNRKNNSFKEDDFESVINSCLAGNPSAQRVLFKQYFGYAKSVCLRYCSSSEEVDEVLNESFLKVFTNLDKYDPAQPFKAWLRTITINTSISYYRKNNRYNRDTVGLEDAAYPRFDDHVIDNITAEEILELTQQIKPVYRTVFMMYAVDGYNHREISEALSINEATVRSHYVRARAKLQHLIKRNYPELFPADWGIQSYKQNEN